MSRVLLDTVGVLALCDTHDQWHDAASAAFARLQAGQEEFCATTFILAECGNAVARSRFRQSIVDLRARLESEDALIHPSDADWREAWARYESSFPGGPGIVDELSFAVMRRLGMQQAFTNDGHCADAGFEPMF